MPIRVGIDLVSVRSIEESVRDHGARYLQRVYTPREIGDCQAQAGVDPQRLAARFAAKEATLKVLRPGDGGIPWLAIEVLRDRWGAVDLKLSDAAERLAEDGGISSLAVSLTHEEGFASAVVVAELAFRK